MLHSRLEICCFAYIHANTEWQHLEWLLDKSKSAFMLLLFSFKKYIYASDSLCCITSRILPQHLCSERVTIPRSQLVSREDAPGMRGRDKVYQGIDFRFALTSNNSTCGKFLHKRCSLPPSYLFSSLPFISCFRLGDCPRIVWLCCFYIRAPKCNWNSLLGFRVGK